MKLSQILKAATRTLGAAGIATTVVATEAKADDIYRFLDALEQGADIVDRLQNGGRRHYEEPRYYEAEPSWGTSGRRRSCHQNWYLQNGNRGGTFDPCNGERPPYEAYGGDGYEQPRRQRSLQYCFKNLQGGGTATGYARDCQSNYRSWRQLQID